MNRIRLNITSSRAFTLMEVIVVVIIAAVLASLALVKYQHVMAMQNYQKVRQEMLAVYSACRIYKIQHGHYPNNGRKLQGGTNIYSGYVYMFHMNDFWDAIGYHPPDASTSNYVYYYDDTGSYTNIRVGIPTVTTSGGDFTTIWTWLAHPLHLTTDTAHPYNDNPDCENMMGSVPCP